jgi:hypothetical protein
MKISVYMGNAAASRLARPPEEGKLEHAGRTVGENDRKVAE